MGVGEGKDDAYAKRDEVRYEVREGGKDILHRCPPKPMIATKWRGRRESVSEGECGAGG